MALQLTTTALRTDEVDLRHVDLPETIYGEQLCSKFKPRPTMRLDQRRRHRIMLRFLPPIRASALL